MVVLVMGEQSYNRFMARVQLRQPIFPIIIAFLLGLQLIESSRAWVILLVTFTGLFLSAYVWTRTLGRNIQLRRDARLGWVEIGGQAEENLTLSNTSALPASRIELIDHSTLPGFDASKSTSIGSGFFEQWNVTAVCEQRGFFSLGDAEILTGDPFGIFEVTIPALQRTSILVLPQIAALPELLIAPSGSYGEGPPRMNAPQKTIHASTVREYLHGDSTRLVHWPTTARMSKMFVRLMESTPEGSWWILLDLDESNMLGEGWDSIEEQSVTLAASLADFGLRNRKSVGLISSGRELAWHPPQKGEGQRWEIIQSLATARPGKLMLSTLLEKMGPTLGRHSSLVVITASTKTDWLGTLHPLTKRGIIPTVLLLDRSTFGGDTSAENIALTLNGHGIKCHIIPHGLIERPKNIQSKPVNWTWHSTPTGEIVPMHTIG
jgi:uncharacterized protein (DUF58 family)